MADLPRSIHTIFALNIAVSEPIIVTALYQKFSRKRNHMEMHLLHLDMFVWLVNSLSVLGKTVNNGHYINANVEC